MPPSKEPPLPEQIRAHLNSLGAESSAEDWKVVGNECFANECHLSAIRCYTKALQVGGDNAVILSNRSAAYLKSTMFSGVSLALKDAERAVELDNKWYKAHLRVGDAQFGRKKFEEAKEAYKRALELNSACEAAAQSLRLVEQELFLLQLDKEDRKNQEEEIRKQDARIREQDERGVRSGCSANSTLSGGSVTMSGTPGVCNANEMEPQSEIERHIQLWSQEAVLRDGRTAMRAFNARLEDADRVAGVAYKKELLAKFRGRLQSDELLRTRLEEKLDSQMRLGEGVDYRQPERYRSILTSGTDGVGLGISTDAYKSHKYESTMW
ncbi:putative Tetratricopeptide repeat [Trypanosoma vivax]|uniref:Uncharacterized protein n=1 Tax=Trypanosoma vivax (strain Y486) TaxID=1055687 RepID=G0U6U9_TRYVY|nr:hypothetical protein TRVL_02166 [Trypanosoma vivax]KAH8611862.1 putative Tetratricopeptide repeat [Trypanosoma vivax]CCC51605.1 conserved hypothetical protein [Trypanosoma vivax Y486]